MWKLLRRTWCRKLLKKLWLSLTTRSRRQRGDNEAPKRAATPDLFFSIAGSVSVCLNGAYALPAQCHLLVACHGFLCLDQSGPASAVGASTGHPGDLPRSGEACEDGRVHAD